MPATARPTADQPVATVGYPAADSRLPEQELMTRLFGDKYNVKRLAPGQLQRPADDLVRHDCSTLGGNSGSPIVDLATGTVVGLHFSGLFLQENRGVPIGYVTSRLDKLRAGGRPTSPPPPPPPADEGQTQAVSPPPPPPPPSPANGATMTFTIPLHVSVTVGATVPGGAAVTAVGERTESRPAVARNPFGKFASVGEFLESYKTSEDAAAAAAEQEVPFEERVKRRRDSLSGRAVVQVSATLRHREPDDTDGDRHVRLRITVSELAEGNPAVNADVQRAIASGEDVFVAIRIGDSMGIKKPIKGLVDGVGLSLKGEWIPKEKARSHGGEAMSVLHFTHHPLGFICVEEPAECFS